MGLFDILFHNQIDEQKAGAEFELTCAEILKKRGFKKVRVTQESRDQGADIIAWKKGYKYAVQCKLYGRPVGNKAVQEVYAAKTFYGCHRAAVMTNQTFTRGAIELAEMTDVELWGDTPTKLKKTFLSTRSGMLLLFVTCVAFLLYKFPVLISKDYLPISAGVLCFIVIAGLWIKHIFGNRAYANLYEDEEFDGEEQDSEEQDCEEQDSEEFEEINEGFDLDAFARECNELLEQEEQNS